jgi:hypothetical protein
VPRRDPVNFDVILAKVEAKPTLTLKTNSITFSAKEGGLAQSCMDTDDFVGAMVDNCPDHCDYLEPLRVTLLRNPPFLLERGVLWSPLGNPLRFNLKGAAARKRKHRCFGSHSSRHLRLSAHLCEHLCRAAASSLQCLSCCVVPLCSFFGLNAHLLCGER